ncbi:MAG: response regulator [Candidatus Aenigmarchaeota archaeon]|nr:response regulator [Candidatus Aenigmarchaeota archaeon]
MSKKILIVDDEPNMRYALVRSFELMGCETYQAINARTALDAYRRLHPDIVLTDFQLGRDNGVLLAREIGTYEKSAGLKSRIFLMSGDDVRWKNVRIDGFYCKPISQEGIREMSGNL